MKNLIVTVNGVAYNVTVEELGTGAAPLASAPVPAAAPARCSRRSGCCTRCSRRSRWRCRLRHQDRQLPCPATSSTSRSLLATPSRPATLC